MSELTKGGGHPEGAEHGLDREQGSAGGFNTRAESSAAIKIT